MFWFLCFIVIFQVFVIFYLYYFNVNPTGLKANVKLHQNIDTQIQERERRKGQNISDDYSIVLSFKLGNEQQQTQSTFAISFAKA